ncbi:MAG: gerKC1 [Clostridiaceae bacterium]|jgi:Ger(x)C family germination protein|nr:gerKC1 [Clostridiaceae bacterium]
MNMHIKNKVILVNIIFFIFFPLLTGCYDKSELGEISVVSGLGIDKISGNEPISVTLEIVNPRISGGGSMDVEKSNSSNTQTSTGKTLYEAMQNFSKKSSTIMDFSHAKVIVLSRDLCESGISEIIDYLNRDRQFRGSNWILVSNKTAKEILQSKIPNEDITSMGIDNIMKLYKKNGPIMTVNLNDYTVWANSESRASFAPIIDIDKSQEDSKGKIKIENTAVFKNNKLIGTLPKEESSNLLWLYNNSKTYKTTLTLKLDELHDNVTVDVYKRSTKIIPVTANGEINFKIECTADVSIRENKNITFTQEIISSIEHNTEDQLKKELNKLIDKAQNTYDTDFVGFSEKIYENNSKEWVSLKSDWDKVFPNIKYDINYKVDVTNTGIIKDPSVGKSEEAKSN